MIRFLSKPIATLGAVTLSLITPVLAQEPTAFIDVSVIPMDRERVLEHQTVVVRGDRITALGHRDEVVVPEGTRRIDGAGKYLMPGLGEMHGHIPGTNAPEWLVEDVLFLYLAGGVTTVRGMLGAPNQLELRERINRGDLLGPNLYLAGPSFSGNSISSAAQAARRVREQKRQGWDLLKVHPGLTREEYDSLAITAHEVGITFGGHVPSEVGLAHAIEMGQETFDHVDGYIAFLEASDRPLEEEKVDRAIEMTLAAGAWIVPTMALWETVIGAADLDQMKRYPELEYLPGAMVEGWVEAQNRLMSHPRYDPEGARIHAENRRILLKEMSDAGVKIIMGTDAPQRFSVPGFSIHREIEIMADAGMSPFEILASGTRMVGDYFEHKDRFGIVEPGYRADLVLLPGNPLRDLDYLADPAGVMVRGNWIPREEIDARLAGMPSRTPAP